MLPLSAVEAQQTTVIDKADTVSVIDNPISTSLITKRAYLRFGEKYYIPNLGYPLPLDQFNIQDINDITIPLKNESDKNPKANESGFVAIPVNQSSAYYRAEYHLSDLNIDLVALLNSIEPNYKKIGIKKGYSKEQIEEMVERSKVQIVIFPKKDFQLSYHPGKTLLLREKGEFDGAELTVPRGDIEMKANYNHVVGEDLETLICLFNGTFHNEDGKKWVGKALKEQGLIVDGKIIDEPIRNLATIAFYENGDFFIGSYENMPPGKVTMLRQNEYMLLENGQINPKGAFPRMYKRYEDEILRSYIASDEKNEHFAYMWTTYTPPLVAAELARSMGFSNLMLLDMHPVIASIIKKPYENKYQPFSLKNTYYFVPNERMVLNRVVSDLATRIRGPMQCDLFTAIRPGVPHDFFSVHEKPNK